MPRKRRRSRGGRARRNARERSSLRHTASLPQKCCSSILSSSTRRLVATLLQGPGGQAGGPASLQLVNTPKHWR